jgi:hypothetical protein
MNPTAAKTNLESHNAMNIMAKEASATHMKKRTVG